MGSGLFHFSSLWQTKKKEKGSRLFIYIVLSFTESWSFWFFQASVLVCLSLVFFKCFFTVARCFLQPHSCWPLAWFLQPHSWVWELELGIVWELWIWKQDLFWFYWRHCFCPEGGVSCLLCRGKCPAWEGSCLLCWQYEELRRCFVALLKVEGIIPLKRFRTVRRSES